MLLAINPGGTKKRKSLLSPLLSQFHQKILTCPFSSPITRVPDNPPVSRKGTRGPAIKAFREYVSWFVIIGMWVVCQTHKVANK